MILLQSFKIILMSILISLIYFVMNCAISHGYLTVEFLKTSIVLRAKQVLPELVSMSQYIICLLQSRSFPELETF